MIPVRLTLSNFMSYRSPPPLDFNGIHTACICGDNGNGKSTLIDAMTWALWGKTRAKSDADLIYQSQPETMVEFDFISGEQRYRAVRRYSRPKKSSGSGQSILDFQIDSGAGFRSISGNTIAETQQKIIDTLHMDYDTFVNSAYIRQGHADEFTRQSPAKRKEVLSSILGLSRYDLYSEQAKEVVRQAEAAGLRLSDSLRAINEELAQNSNCNEDLLKAQNELSAADQAVAGQELVLKSLKQKIEVLQTGKTQLAQISSRLTEGQKTLGHLKEQAARQRARIMEFEAVLGQRVELVEGASQLETARSLNEELNRKLGEIVKLNEQKHQLERAIEKAAAIFQQEQAVMLSRGRDLENKAGKLPLIEAELEKTDSQQKLSSGREQEIARQKESRDLLRNRTTELESGLKRLKQDVAEIDEKLVLLAGEHEAKCPLCEQELDEHNRQHVRAKYQAEKQQKLSQIETTVVERNETKSRSDAMDKQIIQLETRLNQDKIGLQSKIGMLRKQIEEAKEAEVGFKDIRDKSAVLVQKIEARDYVANERQMMTAIENQLTGLAYDASQHEAVRLKLKELEPFADQKRRLEESVRLIGPEKSGLSQTEVTISSLEASRENDLHQQKALEQEMAVLPGLLAQVEQVENEYRVRLNGQKQMQQAVWNLQQKLQRCELLAIERQEKELESEAAAEKQKIYFDLVQAFGKNGIQAMLIDMALPEIEAEADKLLARMTDNRMHIKMETQRPKKAGGIIETLDINISDELGTRAYEMFSGGESFRINFAIRIALSRLLAHRAGARLPTLIIDEGFGSLDTIGIEKVREAINSIQGDFEKILVITHIEELKDAFPTRIDVVKTAEGSTFSLS